MYGNSSVRYTIRFNEKKACERAKSLLRSKGPEKVVQNLTDEEKEYVHSTMQRLEDNRSFKARWGRLYEDNFPEMLEEELEEE